MIKKRPKYKRYDVIDRLTNERLSKLASRFQYGNIFTMQASPRKGLQNKTEADIIKTYNKELIKIAIQCVEMKQFNRLYKLRYLAEKSCILTIATKRKATYKQTVRRLRRLQQGRLTVINNYGRTKRKFVSFIRWQQLRNLRNKYRNRSYPLRRHQ